MGPYVPAAWRTAPPVEIAIQTEATAHSAEAPSGTSVAAPAYEIPARIPPYAPLRPTPISVPAMRTPLYIPTVKTPESAAPVVEEGEIAPELVHTTEFAVPPAPTPVESSAVSSDLPWIDAFLAATPAVAVPAIAEDVVSASPERAPELAHVTDAVVGSPDVRPADADADADAADEWPLDEAAAEFQALSGRLEAPAAPEPAALFAETAGLPPLPAWSDDEFMDIMPVHSSTRTAAAGSVPANVAIPAAPVIEASAEEAARALEVLARRVREGELALPGYDPRMGEPAALVAALAALLGVRLR